MKNIDKIFSNKDSIGIIDSYYAQFYKHERIKLGITLDQVSRKAKFSISYLSKFENQQITPHKELLETLSDLYNVSVKREDFVITEKMIKEVLKSYINEELEVIKIMYESINKEVFSVQNVLIKCFYYLLNNQFREFDKDINDLENVICNAVEYEKILFVILLIENALLTHQMKDVKYYFNILSEANIEDDVLKWFITTQEIRYGYHNNEYWLIANNLKSGINNNIFKTSLKRNIILELMMMDLEACNNHKILDNQLLQENFNQAFFMYGNDVLLYKFLMYIRVGKYNQVFEEVLNGNVFCESKIIALLAYCAYQLKDSKRTKELYMILKNHVYEKTDLIHKWFIEVMMILIKDPELVILENHEKIKGIILRYFNTYNHNFYDLIYKKIYIELLRNESRYKEALNFIQKNNLIK